jgi:hypothetical protein
MTPKEILIPLAIFALQACVIKWIDVKIRFAKSEAEAMAAIKAVWVRFWSWTALAAPGVLAFFEFIKEGPVTKLAVIDLFLFSLGIALKFTLYWSGEIVSILKDYGNISVDVHSVLEGQNVILRDFHTELVRLRGEKTEPNQPSEPTAMSVTPPAGQEPRQP